MSKVGLLRSALASYEDADALDHLGRRACSLRQEDIGTGCAIEGVDRARDNHGGEAGLQLFSAADQLVAVHLGHDEVAEKKIEGAGSGLLYNFKRLLRGERCNDAIASGFEEKSPDREYLLVVVYAENRLLGPQCSLVFCRTPPYGMLRPMGHPGASAGLQTHWYGVFKKWPRGPAGNVLQHVVGRLLRRRQKEETKLSCLLPEGTVTPVRSARLPDHGVREMPFAWQVATLVYNRRRGSVCRGCSEERSHEKMAQLRLRLQAAMVRWVTSRLQAVKRLSTQVVRNTGERTHRRQPRIACEVVVNAFQQYECTTQLATAKFERRWQILELAHPPTRENARIH